MFGLCRRKADVSMTMPDDRIKKTMRILFIDDQEMPRVEALRQHGYNVFQKYDVKDIAELEAGEYHVVFCDIHGVGAGLSADQGAGLIRLIKGKLKYPAVIAYSAMSYAPASTEAQTMRRDADDVIGKDADLESFMTKCDEWGRKVFSTDRCIQILSEFNKGKHSDLKSLVERAASGNHSDWVEVVKLVTTLGKAAVVTLQIARFVLVSA